MGSQRPSSTATVGEAAWDLQRLEQQKILKTAIRPNGAVLSALRTLLECLH
ncbi:MAG: hypothetical protein ACHBN1_08180 [Heteroscytonema crispum UTEX LB 1556]